MSTLPDNGAEWVQANFNIPELSQAAAQAEIVAAVSDHPGVQSVMVSGQSLHVVYDPVTITEHELEKLLTGSGHTAKDATVERDTPFA